MEQEYVNVDILQSNIIENVRKIKLYNYVAKELESIVCNDRTLDKNGILNALFQRILPINASNQTNFNELGPYQNQEYANYRFEDIRDIAYELLENDTELEPETEQIDEDNKFSENSYLPIINTEGIHNMQYKQINDG